jgi:hypothetical protein
MPCGGGMYVRREVAAYYIELNDNGQRKVQIDRTGKSLFSEGGGKKLLKLGSGPRSLDKPEWINIDGYPD